ncbi:MAG: hypothetical protein Q8R37_01250, partial [Nanoarchaeota archaeon]|nr:hypothetical protein [Nanoarchaeota archaeon]
TGFAKTQKFSAELAKLNDFIAQDAAKAQSAIENLNAEGSEVALEDASELSEELAEQEVLDGVVGEAAAQVAAEEELTPESEQLLGALSTSLSDSTKSLKGKVTEKKVAIAGKLVAKGKSIKEVKDVVRKGSGSEKSASRTTIRTKTEVRQTSDGVERKSETRIRSEQRVNSDVDQDADQSSGRGSSSSGRGNGRR